MIILFTWEFDLYKKWTNLDIQRIKLPSIKNPVVSVYIDLDQCQIRVQCMKMDEYENE